MSGFTPKELEAQAKCAHPTEQLWIYFNEIRCNLCGAFISIQYLEGRKVK